MCTAAAAWRYQQLSASELLRFRKKTHAQQVAQAQMAQAGPAEVPEQVLITGSLIHGAVAVGVPSPI